MATHKKKSEGITLDMPGTAGSAKVILPKNKASSWPKIKQGTHLTVKTFEDGKTELVWDDDALLADVREALASVQFDHLKPAVKAKVATRAKKKST
jgi:hypothetical protein